MHSPTAFLGLGIMNLFVCMFVKIFLLKELDFGKVDQQEKTFIFSLN